MDLEPALPFIYAGLGALSNVFVPWLIKRVKDPDSPDSKFSWRYVWPKLVTFLIILLVAPVIGNVEAITGLTFVPAYLAGWAIADLGQTFILDGVIGYRNRNK